MTDIEWWANELTEADRRGLATGKLTLPEPTKGQAEIIETAGAWLEMDSDRRTDLIGAANGDVWPHMLEREFIRWAGDQDDPLWLP